jgi:hypothetical protein
MLILFMFYILQDPITVTFPKPNFKLDVLKDCNFQFLPYSVVKRYILKTNRLIKCLNQRRSNNVILKTQIINKV